MTNDAFVDSGSSPPSTGLPKVRTSPRFPRLSSVHWRSLRAERANAHREFAKYQSTLIELGVLRGLRFSDRAELTAWVAELDSTYQQWLAARNRHMELLRVRREISRRARRIERLAKDVADSLSRLADYLEPFDGTIRGEYFRGERRVGFASVPESADLRREAARYLAMKPGTATDVPRWQRPLDHPAATTCFSQELAHFFERSGLSKTESEIRAAMIGNALWNWRVPVVARKIAANVRRGAETLRSRRRRFSKWFSGFGAGQCVTKLRQSFLP